MRLRVGEECFNAGSISRGVLSHLDRESFVFLPSETADVRPASRTGIKHMSDNLFPVLPPKSW